MTREHPHIIVLPDLHADSWWRRGGEKALDVTGLGRWILDSAPDLLILAGDIANDPTRNWAAALREVAEYILPEDVVVMTGNHDYYGHLLDGDDQLRRLAENAGMRFAQKEEIRIGKTRILCCTLWTDFAFNGDATLGALATERGLNDYQWIRTSQTEGLAPCRDRFIRASDTLAVHRDHRAWLEEALRSPHFAGEAGKTIVVTHHGPSRATAAGAIDALTPAFHSDLDDLILETQPDAWVFGHSHRPCRAIVGSTDVRCVSIGYPMEWRSGSYAEITTLAVVP